MLFAALVLLYFIADVWMRYNNNNDDDRLTAFDPGQPG